MSTDESEAQTKCLMCRREMKLDELRDHIAYQHYCHESHRCLSCKMSFGRGMEAYEHGAMTGHGIVLNIVSVC